MKFLKLQWQQYEDYNESEDYVLEKCFCDALGPTCSLWTRRKGLSLEISLHTKVITSPDDDDGDEGCPKILILQLF